MILVTLGTQDKSFVRLLEAIDREIEKGNIKEEVIAQIGYTKYESKNMRLFDFIPTDELEHLIEKCDLLITHGGVGSILSGVTKRKKVLAAPRLKKYKEHTNDHQKQITSEFHKQGYILEIKDMNQLSKTLEKAKTFRPKKYQSNTKNMIELIENYIEKEEKRSMKKTILHLWNTYQEVIMYLIFGVLTTVVSLVSYYLLTKTFLDPSNGIEIQIANVISWSLSVLFAYITNRKYVFNSHNENKFQEACSFVGARLLTLVMDMLIMFIGVTKMGMNDRIMKLVSQVVVIILNYVFSKLFVFKKDK